MGEVSKKNLSGDPTFLVGVYDPFLLWPKHGFQIEMKTSCGFFHLK